MKQIDNFLIPPYFNQLKEKISSENFEWYYQKSSLNNRGEDDEFMFTHVLWRLNEGNNSNMFHDFWHTFLYVKHYTKCKELLRMKLNLYTNQNKKIYHSKHNDIMKDGKPQKDVTIVVLNFTNCNGSTIIDGKEFRSKENSALIFNNTIEHQGTTQTDTNTRIVLNMAVR
tara:strand:+ start:1085 stop:1594 length:510 start_codon:yes stop_codon:yes gene_type:complete